MPRSHTWSLLALLCLATLVPAVNAELPVHASNDVELDEAGWIRPIAGDPYLVMRAGGIDPDAHPVLEVTVEGQHVLNRHLYAELFWASDKRGFSEEFKGFYLIPFSPKGDALAVQLNFRDFLRALEDDSERIDLIRIDLNPSLMQTDFRCRISARWIEANSVDDRAVTVLHPPYLSRYLMKPGVTRYVASHLPRDIFHRFTRDWLFLLLYGGTLVALLTLLWRWRKTPQEGR